MSGESAQFPAAADVEGANGGTVTIPAGVVPGETAGWPVDVDDRPLELTDAQRAELATLDDQEPGPKRYRVPDHVNHRVFEHWPGDVFEAEIPPKQEARLLASGALELADREQPDAAGDEATQDNPKGE